MLLAKTLFRKHTSVEKMEHTAVIIDLGHREQTIESPLSAVFHKVCGWGICTPKSISLELVDQSSKFFFMHQELYVGNLYSGFQSY